MSDNNDFDDDQIDFGEDSPDGGFEEFEGGGTSIGDMWRNNPLVKIAVIAAVLVFIIGAVILFGGKPDTAQQSFQGTSGGVKGTPGEGGISEDYRQRVQAENQQRAEEAVRDGTSTMPVPLNSPIARLQVEPEEEQAEDPLERWRRIQEERRRQTSREMPTEAVADPHADAIDALANAIAAQMEGILESKKILEPININITDERWLENLREEEEEERQQALAASGQLVNDDGEIVNILIPAGSIEYGQLLIEANSDIEDGPVLVHLVSGPLAGARMLGDFDVEEEYLVLNFDVIVIDGISHGIEAIALDPDTTLPAVATEVDQRYFRRVILPAAAAFVEGFGEAVSETNSTTVVVDGGSAVSDEEELDTREEFFKGFEAASEKVGEILDEDSDNIDPLIRVEAGTPIGILFTEPVTDERS